MQISKTALFTIIGVSQAVAQTPVPTPITTFDPDNLNPGLSDECFSVDSSVKERMDIVPPPEDPALSELVVSFAIGGLHNTQDPCELPVVTGSLAPVFSEWASRWTSKQSEYISEYRMIWTACSDEPLVTDLAPVGSEVCSDLVAKITGAPSYDEKNEKDEEKEKKEDADEEKAEKKTDDKPEVVGDSAGARLGGSFLAGFVAVGVVAVAL
ncbi:uncharacterized protein FOBCDRAFT_203794 [Fusarium oxysporum Fo47]|uniref:Uncharacterized protein n=1 Tax=Fusarium oxysporum Fo47 TaxID=660027 RepID=W9JE11_FUSOX|nr:uncharacterized protein FOBCDRAFT_203794 [Fusarium oxysporum Fo47]EWZ27930.1 hypothetical protein FOZG_18346 [Fusarium oxysporum Fo47]QKD56730.1 hypothetical protein FOBCDRAFT_203794 [Fusarium oxysporum Fo47]